MYHVPLRKFVAGTSYPLASMPKDPRRKCKDSSEERAVVSASVEAVVDTRSNTARLEVSCAVLHDADSGNTAAAAAADYIGPFVVGIRLKPYISCLLYHIASTHDEFRTKIAPSSMVECL
jgi:hypothetical protein